jgi:hypothetical protein
MSHFRKVCKHGTSMGQCRCAAPNKELRLAACLPSHAEWTEDEHPILYTGEVNGIAHPVKVEPIEWGEPQKAKPAPEKRPALQVTYTGIADVLEAEGWSMVTAIEQNRMSVAQAMRLADMVALLGRLSRRFRELDSPPPLE